MAYRATLTIAVLALLFASARAQANAANFNGLEDDSLFFSYGPFPSTANARSAIFLSNATSLRAPAANIDSRIFYVKPCESFVPHWHPSASELAVGQTGVMTFNILFNGRLVRRDVKEGDHVLLPQGALHYFTNPTCEQATVISTLTSNTPGLQALYNPPRAITDGNFTLQQFQEFAATTTPNNTLDRARAFPALTSDCAARCAPKPPTRKPTRRGLRGSLLCKLGVRFSVGSNGRLIKLGGRC